ncbi:MAG: hypothetical protein EZS28_013989 [Streblomastix strix]|uniref:Uncharacterized protein n=1 Tax=Streblomastix strix TaxID=222440 RepID=A0A5J4W7F2_9EUKA|nr:MAG: hypothetical protein EZS28_013989 [Streblomastix strix]
MVMCPDSLKLWATRFLQLCNLCLFSAFKLWLCAPELVPRLYAVIYVGIFGCVVQLLGSSLFIPVLIILGVDGVIFYRVLY